MKIYTKTGDRGETSLWDGKRVHKDSVRVESYGTVDAFIVTGTSQAAAALHVARTVCRRAERRILALSREVEISPHLIKFVNRLSDVIYTFARYLESQIILMDFEAMGKEAL